MRVKGHTYTHAPKVLVKKYAEVEFTDEEYETEIGQYILRVAGRVMDSEWEILRVTERMRGTANDLEMVMMTPPGGKPPEIMENILNIRQVDNLQAEIVRRGERIKYMREIAMEYRKEINARGSANGG